MNNQFDINLLMLDIMEQLADIVDVEGKAYPHEIVSLRDSLRVLRRTLCDD